MPTKPDCVGADSAELPIGRWTTPPTSGTMRCVTGPRTSADGTTVVLRSPRRRHAIGFALAAVFVIGGIIGAIANSDAVGWLCAAFFGLLLVMEGWQLLSPGRLVITPTTMEFSILWRHWSRDLASCTGFQLWRNPFARRTLVAFDHPLDSSKRLGKASRQFGGRSGALPDAYGMEPSKLVALLNKASNAARAA